MPSRGFRNFSRESPISPCARDISARAAIPPQVIRREKKLKPGNPTLKISFSLRYSQLPLKSRDLTVVINDVSLRAGLNQLFLRATESLRMARANKELTLIPSLSQLWRTFARRVKERTYAAHRLTPRPLDYFPVPFLSPAVTANFCWRPRGGKGSYYSSARRDTGRSL